MLSCMNLGIQSLVFRGLWLYPILQERLQRTQQKPIDETGTPGRTVAMLPNDRSIG